MIGRPEPEHADVLPLSPPLDETVERRLKLAMDVGERAFSVLMFSILVVTFLPNLTAAPVNGLLVLSEGLVMVFMVLRRFTQDVSTRPFDWLIALAGTAAPLLVHPAGSGTHALAPQAVYFGVWLFGVAFSIWGKLTLRRSFGLAAANRGVVEGGPYMFMRHPIYSGYIMTYIASLLANPLTWNAGLYLCTSIMIIIRVVAEERVLKADPAYAAFMAKVRYRLAPGLF